MTARLWPPVTIAATLFAAGTGWFALGGTWRAYPWFAVATVVVTAALLVAGAELQRNTRSQRMGLYMVGVAALWPSTWWAVGDGGYGAFLSTVANNLMWSVFGTGLFSYPDERGWDRHERAFVISLWVFLLPTAVAYSAVSKPEWNGFDSAAWWPTVHSSRTGYTVLTSIFGVGSLLLAVMGGILLSRRLRSASGLDRAVLRPALAGVVGAVLLAGSTGILVPLIGSQTLYATASFFQGLALLIVPVALLFAAMRSRITRAEVAETIVRATRPSASDSVQNALRAALRDESLVVLFLAEGKGYVDLDGQLATLPSGDPFLTSITGSDGQDLGVLLGDPRLREHQVLVERAVAAAAYALENAAMHAGLRAQMESLRASRTRIVEVQQAERRRLERDLHDGAQQQMLAIALRLELARNESSDPETRESLDGIKVEMRRALAEIRNLANGIQPGVLVQGGLGPALQSVTDGMSVPVRIDVPTQRFSAEAESAAYFVACEALANITKHARAATASVTAAVAEGWLRLEILDDGIGTAEIETGSGLRGLNDRVQALGGRLDVVSEPGIGTRLTASIPCG